MSQHLCTPAFRFSCYGVAPLPSYLLHQQLIALLKRAQTFS